MDRSAAFGTSYPASSTDHSIATAKKIESAAQAAHQTVDRVAEKATAQVDQLSGTAHRAVDSAADTATSAAAWASTIPEKARRAQSALTESASGSIRARPLTSVLGALAIGFLLGRLLRS
jgi:ElaB/YqjD/DUF883 family membrane-anchored ribosome-binding protein